MPERAPRAKWTSDEAIALAEGVLRTGRRKDALLMFAPPETMTRRKKRRIRKVIGDQAQSLL